MTMTMMMMLQCFKLGWAPDDDDDDDDDGDDGDDDDDAPVF